MDKILLFFLIILCAACSGSEENIDQYGSEQQDLFVKVESVGEISEKENTVCLRNNSSGISGITPMQSIDKVVMIIVDRNEKGKIVYKTSFSDWNSTTNKVSKPYVNGHKRGRMTTVTLTGRHRLKMEHVYVAYAVGYHSGSYEGYEPFSGLEEGDFFTEAHTEKVTLSDGERVSEIFAGAQTLININGSLIANAKDPEISDEPAIRLRRQVAGIMCYFTGIPAEVDGIKICKIQLVASRKNRSALFAGFRSLEDPNSFNKENVINGFNPCSDYNASLCNTSQKNAFVVSCIDLKDWFPGDLEFPVDWNNDKLLDVNDTNWQIPDYWADSHIKLQKGSVYTSCYWMPLAMMEEDIHNEIPTFQLQLLGKDSQCIKAWNIQVRQFGELLRERTLVSFEEGRVKITTEDNPESFLTYSISRNSIYALGAKNSDQSVGEDVPINLNENQNDLVMDVNPEWKALDSIIFN